MVGLLEERGPAAGVLVFAVGLTLPIEVVGGVPDLAFDLLRFAGLAALAVAFRPRLERSVARWVALPVLVLVAAAVAQLAFTVPREPVRPAASFFASTLVSVGLAALLTWRVGAHRRLLSGFAVGVTVSAFVCLLQAAGLPAPRASVPGVERYPGLAWQTPGLSWQSALAVIVGFFVARTAVDRRLRVAAWGQVGLCLVALAVCGAQGGLLGLAVAMAVSLAFGWRQVDKRTLALLAPGVVAVGVATAALTLVTGVGAASVRGTLGDQDKGFTNEVARVDAARAGWDELVDHPITGIGREHYDARYPVAPHFLPLNLSVSTGVLGLVLGSVLLGWLLGTTALGPVGRSPTARLGAGLLAVMCVQTFVTPSGPFLDAGPLSILLVAAVACRGGFAREADNDAAPAPAVSLADEVRPASAVTLPPRPDGVDEEVRSDLPPRM